MEIESVKKAHYIIEQVETLQNKISALGKEEWDKRYKLLISPDHGDRPSPTFIDLEKDDFEQVKSVLFHFWTKKIAIYREQLENLGVT